MSETTLAFQSSKEAKTWLENQTTTILTPVQAQAKQLRDNMNNQIQSILEVSKLLFDVSTKEIEKRNMKVYNRARALNKLARLFIDRLKKTTSPEQVSYESINNYVQEIQKVLFVIDIDIKNWFPRISPFFIMDRRKFLAIYEKTKQAYNSLNDFLTKEYIKTKTLEEALLELSTVQDLEKQIVILQQEKDNIKNERVPLEQEISDLEKKIDELKSKGPIDKLNLINAEIGNLNNEAKNNLRHLQKPFIKMQALATSGGGGGITPDEVKQINQYLDNPFNALVTEKPGFPELKAILEKLKDMIAKDSLKLKTEKARKAEQTIDEILHKNSLDKLQVICFELSKNRSQILESAKMDEINENLTQCQDQLNILKARKASVETHETVKTNTYQETVDKISNLKRTIERDVNTATGKKIKIT